MVQSLQDVRAAGFDIQILAAGFRGGRVRYTPMCLGFEKSATRHQCQRHCCIERSAYG